jgi:hypothetical protein
MTKSLIGYNYIPYDNSYSVNLTSASNHPYRNESKYLAGTFDSDPKICVIVSEPFMCRVNSIFEECKLIEMIMVQYDGQTSSVMFSLDYVRDNKLMDNGIPMNWEDEG